MVAKPPGMPVHPSPGHDRDSLLNRVAYYCQEKGQQYAFRPLYRLDRDTSGIVVVGKHRTAVSSAQVKKLYYGIVQGELDCQGTVTHPLPWNQGARSAAAVGKDGQVAVTHWEALASAEGHTLLRFQLETGRTHQIRVHMAYTGHPLAGDDLYGGSRQLLGRQGPALRVAFPLLQGSGDIPGAGMPLPPGPGGRVPMDRIFLAEVVPSLIRRYLYASLFDPLLFCPKCPGKLGGKSFAQPLCLRLGCSGPDFFFCHRFLPFWKGRSLKDYGGRLHRETPSKVLGAMRDFLKEHPDPVYRSYVWGFVCHYSLDCTAHPLRQLVSC